MNAKNNGGKKGRVYYCIKEKGKWETCIKAEFIEPKVIEALGEHLTYVLSNNDNFNIFYNKYKLSFKSRKSIYERAIEELQLQIDKNNNCIADCIYETNKLELQLNYDEINEYHTNSKLIEDLKELLSYLNISGDILNVNKNEINEKIITTIPNKDTLKSFILQKKNLLDTIKSNIINEDLYRRGLCLLLYDLVDKIIYNEDKSIEIILK